METCSADMRTVRRIKNSVPLTKPLISSFRSPYATKHYLTLSETTQTDSFSNSTLQLQFWSKTSLLFSKKLSC